jgi:ABC-type Fe3+/spermidine/putrescine transport system ATPase subunit
VTDLLRIDGLTVRHGATVALDDLSLRVRRDELFVLLGASGSGKTTLLRAIAGFVRPGGGRVALDGVDIGLMPPHRRPVNTVFQSYALFPHMTVAANIAFGLRHLSKSAVAERVAEVLALVRLEALADRRPHQLSGGQQQRVALARGLAPRPALLLLDEPLSALDRALRTETRDELVRLRRTLGTSFILVTHDQQEALTMADRIGVMRDGRIVQIGAPAEVYERPASRYVAEFLGAANILPVVVSGDGRAELPGLGSITVAAGVEGASLLALRPERLRLDGCGLANQLPGVLEATVYGGEALGHTIRLANGSTIRVTLALRDGLNGVPPIGSAVTVSWPPEAGVLLPS